MNCLCYVSSSPEIFGYIVTNVPESLKEYRKIVAVDTRIANIEEYKQILQDSEDQNFEVYSFDDVLNNCEFDFDVDLYKSMKLTLKFITPYFVFKTFGSVNSILFLDEDTILTDNIKYIVDSNSDYCWSTAPRVVGLEKFSYLKDPNYKANADAFLSAWNIDLDTYADNFAYYCGGEYHFVRPLNLDEMREALKHVALDKHANDNLKDRKRSFRYCFPDMWFWTGYCFKHHFIVLDELVEITYPNKQEKYADRFEFAKEVLTNGTHGHFTGKGTLDFYKDLIPTGLVKPSCRKELKSVDLFG